MTDQTQQQEQAAPVDWRSIAFQRETELKREGERLRAAVDALARVRALADEWDLHAPPPGNRPLTELRAALDEPEHADTTQPEPSAVVDRQTAEVLAALHRSAEDTVTRVIDLYERWVKAGPPPLGTSINRWWDTRLAELAAALNPKETP